MKNLAEMDPEDGDSVTGVSRSWVRIMHICTTFISCGGGGGGGRQIVQVSNGHRLC